MEQLIEVKVYSLRKIWVKFSDGLEGSFDYEKYFDYKGVFAPLLDQNYFSSVKIMNNSLSWPNGADICPSLIRSIISKEPIIIDNVVVFQP